MQQRSDLDAILFHPIGDDEPRLVDAQLARSYYPPWTAEFRKAAKSAQRDTDPRLGGLCGRWIAVGDPPDLMLHLREKARRKDNRQYRPLSHEPAAAAP